MEDTTSFVSTTPVSSTVPSCPDQLSTAPKTDDSVCPDKSCQGQVGQDKSCQGQSCQGQSCQGQSCQGQSCQGQSCQDQSGEKSADASECTDGSVGSGDSDVSSDGLSENPALSSLMSLFMGSLFGGPSAETIKKISDLMLQGTTEPNGDTTGVRVFGSEENQPVDNSDRVTGVGEESSGNQLSPISAQSFGVPSSSSPSLSDQMAGLMTLLSGMKAGAGDSAGMGDLAGLLSNLTSGSPSELKSIMKMVLPAILKLSGKDNSMAPSCRPRMTITQGPSSRSTTNGSSDVVKEQMGFEVVMRLIGVFDQWINKPKPQGAHLVVEHRVKFVSE